MGTDKKLDQILSEITLLKDGQQRNHDLIQKNGIKIEAVGSDVKAVAEGHSVIRSEMRQMEGRLTSKIDENTASIKFVAARA